MARAVTSAKSKRNFKSKSEETKRAVKMVRVAVHGACGRMGARIIVLLPEFPDLKLVSALDAPRSPNLGREVGGVKVTAELGQAQPDVLIDFSEASATQSRLVSWGQRHLALVIGTTGLSEAALAALGQMARKAPVLVAPNMSLGANALFVLAQAAGKLLPGWDAGIIESHHRLKKDAPSGTALALGSAYAKTSGRPAPIQSLRIGDVVGEHELVLVGNGERLRLSHSALSRDVFARGALTAARFAASAKPGLYGMADVLGA